MKVHAIMSFQIKLPVSLRCEKISRGVLIRKKSSRLGIEAWQQTIDIFLENKKAA